MEGKTVLLSIFFSAFFYFSVISAAYELKNPTERAGGNSKLSSDTLYCYHFTWMGENFNNRTFATIRNKTCNQYFKDKKTLCINPMVATFNGGEPDIDYIRENHANEATCRLSQDQVCVKYTVYYNGITSYETRYCTRVNIDMEPPMKSGCVQERNGNHMTEVCACRSKPGPRGICNSAMNLSKNNNYIITWMLISLLIYNFYKDRI